MKDLTKGHAMTIIEIETKGCPVCGQFTYLTVDKAAFERWLSGQHVQAAFPELSEDEREMLVSGMCAPCWADLNPENDEDDPTLYHADGTVCDCYDPDYDENGEPVF